MYPRDRSGERSGRLTVLQLIQRNPVLWLCACDCGQTSTIKAEKIGTTQSCGCLRQDVTREKALRHGATKSKKWTPEYRAWVSMKTRCKYANREDFKNYGGRGIDVCDEWKANFEAFFSHVGPRPSEKHSLDRINNNGNYEPGNVRWATIAEQAKNRRPRGPNRNRVAGELGETFIAGMQRAPECRAIRGAKGSDRKV